MLEINIRYAYSNLESLETLTVRVRVSLLRTYKTSKLILCRISMVNSRSNSLTLELAGYCAIAAIISAFTAHKLTKAAATKAENARRLEEAKAASLANVERNNAQVEKGLPRGSKDDDLKIDSIYVWELEDLKKRFPSEG